MIITPASDEDVMRVISHPEIWPKISDDRIESPDKFDFGLIRNWVKLAGHVGSDLIGVAFFHPFRDGTKFHPNVLPEYRRKYAYDFTMKSMESIKGPFYVEIPDIYNGVQKFAKRCGFQFVSSKPSSAAKSGNHYAISLFKRGN